MVHNVRYNEAKRSSEHCSAAQCSLQQASPNQTSSEQAIEAPCSSSHPEQSRTTVEKTFNFSECYLYYGRAGGIISGSLFCVRSGDLTTPHTLHHINIYTAPHPKRSQTRNTQKNIAKRLIQLKIVLKSGSLAAAW